MNENQNNILTEYSRYLYLKEIKTAGQYIATLKEFFIYLDTTDKEYDRLSKAGAEDYRAYLVASDNKLSRFTINNKLNRINIFYRFLLKKGYISSNPFYRIKRLKQGEVLPKNILSVDDMGKLLDNFSIKNDNDLMMKSIVELLYGSGLRISEVVGLKLNDIDFESGYITITEPKNNDKRRKVVATDVSLRSLREYIRYSRGKTNSISSFIYPQYCSSAIRKMLNEKLKKECQRLHIRVVTTHSFRHSIATQLLRAGAGIREVQAFLGHKNITSTEIYTRIVKDDLKNVIEKCHPREQKND